jgi:hypothetical protein
MATVPQEHNGFIEWLSGQWFWLVALVTGATHAANAQSKINRHDEQLRDLKDVPVQIARLETKIDALLEDRKRG